MRVTRFQGESNIRELVTRLYTLGPGDPSPAEVATRLVEANQHLPLRSRSLAKAVPEGTLIAVPELTGAIDHRSSAGVPHLATRVARARAIAVVERISADLDARARATDEALAAEAAQIEGTDWQKAAAGDESVAAAVKDAASRVEAAQARARAVADAHARTVEQARAMIDRLAGATGGG